MYFLSLQKKLPNNPVIIVSPSGPTDRWLIRSARARHWERMLSDLAQVELVHLPPSEKEGGATPVSPFLHQMVSAILGRIREVKKTFPDRPVVLIGWGVGAAVNCQVAAMETIAANVCLGFPMHTIDGMRGEADDPILELRSPVLFVQGQIASNSRSAQ
jgi:regulatory NSL complex subunit 3